MENQNLKKTTVYRFDVFRGNVDENGKVIKVKTVGSAYVREGLSTYTLHLKTLLKDTFYLLQNTRSPSPDFVILTRELAQNMNRKYFWNNVGEGHVLSNQNEGIMKLNWDVIGGELYMKIDPISVTEIEPRELDALDQAA